MRRRKKTKLARFTVHTVLIMWQNAQIGSLPGLKCNCWDTYETGKGSGKTGITKHCVTTNRSAMFHLLHQVKCAVHGGQAQDNRGLTLVAQHDHISLVQWHCSLCFYPYQDFICVGSWCLWGEVTWMRQHVHPQS